jgi:hypothetical protein
LQVIPVGRDAESWLSLCVRPPRPIGLDRIS